MGKSSSTTRYSACSALTNAAVAAPRAVWRIPVSSNPSDASISATFASGCGVILSIMVLGNVTFRRMYARKASASPPTAMASAAGSMAARSFSPLCAQLSMLTRATGAPHAAKRRFSRPHSMAIIGLSGLYAFSVTVRLTICREGLSKMSGHARPARPSAAMASATLAITRFSICPSARSTHSRLRLSKGA